MLLGNDKMFVTKPHFNTDAIQAGYLVTAIVLKNFEDGSGHPIKSDPEVYNGVITKVTPTEVSFVTLKPNRTTADTMTVTIDDVQLSVVQLIVAPSLQEG